MDYAKIVQFIEEQENRPRQKQTDQKYSYYIYTPIDSSQQHKHGR